MISVSTLFSGSSGNCTLLSDGTSNVLIDAGRNCKAICTSLSLLSLSLSDISAVFVTHEHSDHISALDVMMRKHKMPIHVTTPSAREVCMKKSAAENAVVHDGLVFEERVGNMLIRSFPLPHDSAACVGYIAVSDDGDCAGVATDMGYATQEAYENLRACRSIVLESNHDVEMLKNGIYPYYLKQRILSRGGHLSNDACADLCRGLCAEGTEHIMLAHLSHENNTPEKAFSTTRRALDSDGLSYVELMTAPRERPASLNCAGGWK